MAAGAAREGSWAALPEDAGGRGELVVGASSPACERPVDAHTARLVVACGKLTESPVRWRSLASVVFPCASHRSIDAQSAGVMRSSDDLAERSFERCELSQRVVAPTANRAIMANGARVVHSGAHLLERPRWRGCGVVGVISPTPKDTCEDGYAARSFIAGADLKEIDSRWVGLIGFIRSPTAWPCICEIQSADVVVANADLEILFRHFCYFGPCSMVPALDFEFGGHRAALDFSGTHLQECAIGGSGLAVRRFPPAAKGVIFRDRAHPSIAETDTLEVLPLHTYRWKGIDRDIGIFTGQGAEVFLAPARFGVGDRRADGARGATTIGPLSALGRVGPVYNACVKQ